jgi:hypothetical protein
VAQLQDILWRTYFCGASQSHAPLNIVSVAHGLVRHRITILVARIMWRTVHLPQNTCFGAPLKSLSLLVVKVIKFE